MTTKTTTLVETAKKGKRRATLEVLRDRLAEAIDNCKTDAGLAALSLRLERVLVELDEMPGGIPKPADDDGKEVTPDELNDRRAARAAESGTGS